MVVTEVRRDLRTRQVDDVLAVVGSVLGGLGLVWLGYANLLPTSGPLGFVVCWFLSFVLLYTVVTALRHGRTVIADRLAAALVYALAGLVGAVLLVVVGYTFWRGSDALRHGNFLTQDLSHALPNLM
jgi:phosphate transport system permease protein